MFASASYAQVTLNSVRIGAIDALIRYYNSNRERWPQQLFAEIGRAADAA